MLNSVIHCRDSNGTSSTLRVTYALKLEKSIFYFRQVYSFQNKMELAEILANLYLNGYEPVDNDFNGL